MTLDVIWGIFGNGPNRPQKRDFGSPYKGPFGVKAVDILNCGDVIDTHVVSGGCFLRTIQVPARGTSTMVADVVAYGDAAFAGPHRSPPKCTREGLSLVCSLQQTGR